MDLFVEFKLPPCILYNILSYVPRHDVNEIKETRFKIILLSFIMENIVDKEDYLQIYNDVHTMNFYTEIYDYVYVSEKYYFSIMYSDMSYFIFLFDV